MGVWTIVRLSERRENIKLRFVISSPNLSQRERDKFAVSPKGRGISLLSNSYLPRFVSILSKSMDRPMLKEVPVVSGEQ